MAEKFFYPICYEISSESKIAGRRPIKVILHEIFPDDSTWQENGISWIEKYVQANLHSVVGMSITVEFLTDDRDIPYGHGMTEIRVQDNLPLFEDATMVGHFDRAYIDDVEIDGVTKRVLIAEGTLDEMRYPKFVAWLREHMAESTIKGSVEIVGKAEHDGYIIYSGGWKEQGRIPQIYDYSGYAILSVKPADEAAIVMELNNKKQQKEESTMDEKLKNELMAVISGAVSESNSKWDEYWAKVEAKDAEIAQLKLTNAIEAALMSAGAKNVKAARSLLDDSKLKLGDDGKVSGLEDQINAIKKSDSYMFADKAPAPKLKGFQPGASGTVPPGSEVDTSKMTYSEMVAYLAANPDAKI